MRSTFRRTSLTKLEMNQLKRVDGGSSESSVKGM